MGGRLGIHSVKLQGLFAVIPKINRCGLATRGQHQLVHDLVEHALHVRLGGHGLAQGQKALDGVAHARDRAVEGVDFPHERRAQRRSGKIETPHLPGDACQPVQAVANATTRQPAQGQHQSHKGQHGPQHPAAFGGQIAQHLVHGCRQQQTDVVLGPRMERQHHAQDRLAAHVHHDGLPRLWVGLLELREGGFVDIGDVLERKLAICPGVQHAVHLMMGQHLVPVVHQRQLGARREAQLTQQFTQIVQSDVHAHHRPALPRHLAERHAHALSAEKHIRRRQHRPGGFLG